MGFGGSDLGVKMMIYSINDTITGRFKHITTMPILYPTSDKILMKEYNLKAENKVLIMHTRWSSTPRFKHYRTKFKKIFYGTIKELEIFLKNYFKKNVWKKHETNNKKNNR